MSVLEIKTRQVFHLSESPAQDRGWRGWLAGRLRSLAARVDGDRSLRLRLETTPHIPREQTSRCIEAGARHAHSLIREAIHAEVTEKALRVTMPELYQTEEGTSHD